MQIFVYVVFYLRYIVHVLLHVHHDTVMYCVLYDRIYMHVQLSPSCAQLMQKLDFEAADH